jgi:hypothetical protein
MSTGSGGGLLTEEIVASVRFQNDIYTVFRFAESLIHCRYLCYKDFEL